MVREDIVAGLRNAVEKGEPLEEAKQSFISAGYSKADVEEASSSIQSSSVLFAGRGENSPQLKIQTQTAQQLETIKEEKPIPNKSKSNFKIILLILILLFLIGILILTIIFKDKIIALLS